MRSSSGSSRGRRNKRPRSRFGARNASRIRVTTWESQNVRRDMARSFLIGRGKRRWVRFLLLSSVRRIGPSGRGRQGRALVAVPLVGLPLGGGQRRRQGKRLQPGEQSRQRLLVVFPAGD